MEDEEVVGEKGREADETYTDSPRTDGRDIISYEAPIHII